MDNFTSQVRDIIVQHRQAVVDEIGQLFDRSLENVSTSKAAIKSAKKAAKKSAAKASKKSVKSAKKAPRAKGKALKPGEKRDPAVLEQLTEKLHSYIAAHPGEGIEAISAGMGITSRELHLPMKKLAAAKRVKSTGHKRSTKYTAK